LESKAFEEEAEDNPLSAREKLPPLASSYIFAKRYRDSLSDETEKSAATDKIEEGQRLRMRVLMWLVGSPAGQDLHWNELSKRVEDIERSLDEAG
jgi:hypothetical protein